MNMRCQALRVIARDEACIACGSFDGVVLAHSNELQHGKGASIKAHDVLSLYLCARHHSEFDALRTDREACRAFFREHYPQQMIRVAEKIEAGLVLKQTRTK